MNNELVKELTRWFVDAAGVCDGLLYEEKRFNEILSRHEHDEAVEPLEVLAKRKGLEMFVSIAIQGNIGVRDMLGDDYADAEAKARKFLNELPDRGNK